MSSDTLTPPGVNLDDPAELEAMFGNFGHWEHWRKVVLANCENLVRAKFAAAGKKITEDRIKALGREHDNYLTFLVDGLQGRIRRERNVQDSLSR